MSIETLEFWKNMKVGYKGKSVNFIITNQNDLLQKNWLNGRFYESGESDILPFIYAHFGGGLFVDVGAAYGNHTLFFGGICGADVIAIEPVKSHFNHILKNLRANPAIQERTAVWNCAVSDQPGKGTMIHSGIDSRRGGNTMHTLQPGKDVKITTLDEILDGKDPILIKIDVEGHEMRVLGGATKTLEKQPALFIEITEGLEEITEYLKGFGYIRHSFVFNKTPTYMFT